jgi:hypothetical protein
LENEKLFPHRRMLNGKVSFPVSAPAYASCVLHFWLKVNSISARCGKMTEKKYDNFSTGRS